MPPGQRNSNQDEAENSGQTFQNDVNELYGSPDDKEPEKPEEEGQD